MSEQRFLDPDEVVEVDETVDGLAQTVADASDAVRSVPILAADLEADGCHAVPSGSAAPPTTRRST